MKLEQGEETRLLRHLQACFSETELIALGRESRFVQRRTSQIDGYKFLLLNIFNSSSGGVNSLNESCCWLSDQFGVELTKQSLDERYNTYAVAFMRSCFTSVLSKMNKGAVSCLLNLPFESIQLTDSTSFSIPPHLWPHYKGYKGNAGKSVIKLHLNYDLQSGAIADISIGDGCVHDNAYNFGEGEEIRANGLYLRDLGYYSFAYFRALEQAQAYYISRAKMNATFFRRTAEGEYARLALSEYLPEQGSHKELEAVYMGGV